MPHSIHSHSARLGVCLIVHTKRKERNPAERAECRGMWAGSGRESPASASQVGKALPGQPAPGHRALSLPPCTETATLNQFADIQNLEFLHSNSETHGNMRAVWWALLPSPSTENRAMYTVGAQLLCPLSTKLPIPLLGSFKKQSHGPESSLLGWWRQISDSVPQGATSKRLATSFQVCWDRKAAV